MEEILYGLALTLSFGAGLFVRGRMLPAKVRQTRVVRKALEVDGHKHEFTTVDREGWHCTFCSAIMPQSAM